MMTTNEAERKVISGLILEPDFLKDNVERLSTYDFQNRQNRLIFKSIITLHKSGKPVDDVSLSGLLQRNNNIDIADAVSGYYEDIPIKSTFLSSIEFIQRESHKRRFLDILKEAENCLLHNEGPEAMEDAVKRLQNGVDASFNLDIGVNVQSASMTVFGALERLRERWKTGGPFGLKSGFENMDKRLDGLCPGLIALAGSPGAGKRPF